VARGMVRLGLSLIIRERNRAGKRYPLKQIPWVLDLDGLVGVVGRWEGSAGLPSNLWGSAPPRDSLS